MKAMKKHIRDFMALASPSDYQSVIKMLEHFCDYCEDVEKESRIDLTEPKIFGDSRIDDDEE